MSANFHRKLGVVPFPIPKFIYVLTVRVSARLFQSQEFVRHFEQFRGSWLLAVVLAVAAWPAFAQTAASSSEADAVGKLIGQVRQSYDNGEINYRAGHMEAARTDFDHAFDLLALSPEELRKDARWQAEFDRVVDGVNRLEMQALEQGDGFTERKAEPAPIDAINGIEFPVDPKIKAQAEAELKNTRSDLPLMLNDTVAGFITYFSTRGRATLERALQRAGRYRPMIEQVFKEEGVPQDLIYLAQAESGFHPLALSYAKARGMWQFIAQTGDKYGLERSWWKDERQDPEKSTRAAAHHLHDLYAQLGDWYLAMAAYNTGAGNVQAAVRKTGYADFWQLYRRNVLPQQTKDYVPIILAMTIMAKNPDKYGLTDISPDAPEQSDKVTVKYPVDLRLVAECVDAPLDLLVELNPALLRLTTPNDAQFELRLPLGTRDKYQAAIAKIPAEMRVAWRYHKVEPGDTLAGLAKKYHTSAQAIAEANGLGDQEPAAESKVIIPQAPGKSNEAGAVQFSKRARLYKAHKGDSVVSVAEHFGVPEERLRTWNRLQGDRLTTGQLLKVYMPVKTKSSGVINTQAPSKAPKKGSKKGSKKSGKGHGSGKAKSGGGKKKARG